ncbi:MAG TPA: acyl-ACP--UDP-N-acetylglucosamine O-acyltransferase [Terracidiphilus sp.]|nr:acyl-ACP--UDP-N-acetylglucosamine O-acyltransferase [Terracidiphilus sp.]
MSVHPTAIIAPGAIVPASCSIGPYSTIGPHVTLGENCTLVSHVVLDGHTRIGARNTFYPFCSVGVAPQDLKYRGEPTETILGDDNVIRESVTISRGTAAGGGVTQIGSNNLFMTCAHVAHDCHVGSHCVFANAATLAGHVLIEDHVILSAFVPVHQHCTVGQHALVGGGTIVTQDVLPFSITSARRENKAFGINKIGLERRGFSPDRIKELQKTFRLLLSARLNTSQALEKIKALDNDDARLLAAFIERSQRGIIK